MQIKLSSLFLTVVLALHLCFLFSASVQAHPTGSKDPSGVTAEGAEKIKQDVVAAAAASEHGTTAGSTPGGTETERRQFATYLRALDTAIQRSRAESKGPSGSVPFMNTVALQMVKLTSSPEYEQQSQQPAEGEQQPAPNRDELIAIAVDVVNGAADGFFENTGITGLLKIALLTLLETVLSLVALLM
ncbi:hypothetical protein BDB00DRAFT_848586 [Zychaea mexicana]|uniref:uncharacterized protein n=1 Tax=Zychaea mexicana TaxID=64656 RepID=UPI0022FE1B32|nr:uncharacterized protein BDB00DRAFT_848586 [Zychaea mexicana]KAI9488353.1 hypothetical protein BDB00DRAFT_848586 [Zychaea mexicana]